MDRKSNNNLHPRPKSALAPRTGREASAMEDAKPPPPPTLEELANDPNRTHRTWYPKYGRVQKCDYCNSRSEGTLHVCSDCSVRICEHCARDRSWAVHRSRHFIDVDACNWAIKKPPTLAKSAIQRGAKRAAPDNASSGPAARRQKLDNSRSRAASVDENDEDDSAEDDKKLPDVRGQSALRPAAAVGRDGGDRGQSRSRLSAIPFRPDSSEISTPRATPQTSPVPNSRLNARLAASKALLGMSEYARRASQGSFADDDADEHDDPEYRDQEEEEEGDDVGVFKNRGYVETNSSRHPSNRAAVNAAPDARAERARGPSPEPRASGALVSAERPSVTADNEERDNLIKDIYYWIYGTRPTLSPNRIRTQIPDVWEGDRFALGLQPSASSRNARPGYEQHAGESRSSSQSGALPPVRGYEQFSYTENTYNPPSSTYHPTSRTTPNYHPHNAHTPAEVEHLQQDRQTLAEMQDAWIHHPQLARMAGTVIGIQVADNEIRRMYAIEVLWDVLEARRARVLLREDSQTIRWFVGERDRQFRIEHSARAGRSVGSR